MLSARMLTEPQRIAAFRARPRLADRYPGPGARGRCEREVGVRGRVSPRGIDRQVAAGVSEPCSSGCAALFSYPATAHRPGFRHPTTPAITTSPSRLICWRIPRRSVPHPARLPEPGACQRRVAYLDEWHRKLGVNASATVTLSTSKTICRAHGQGRRGVDQDRPRRRGASDTRDLQGDGIEARVLELLDAEHRGVALRCRRRIAGLPTSSMLRELPGSCVPLKGTPRNISSDSEPPAASPPFPCAAAAMSPSNEIDSLEVACAPPGHCAIVRCGCRGCRCRSRRYRVPRWFPRHGSKNPPRQ